ncbi:MAG: aldehyde ferredoxin oxidoreductase C-terminal domain-containing protein [Thermodesulfobacteriota bacterium]|nr:aldehyde ferredoxin oxidoreductase C-terminal domain-containing protein [Thermodesulfobacteriota bacterium]
MNGFMGKILLVNLSEKKSEILTRDEAYYKKYLGGSFLAARLFEEQTKNQTNLTPFSAQNSIIFATGPLAGGGVCGATRVNVLSLSAETPGIFTSQAGGEFGPCMKRAGFDALVITGKADNPTWLNIDNEIVSFQDAAKWWGKDRVTTYQQISKKVDKKHSIATIGPAGENQVTTANIMFEPEHYAGRGGLGAVLGAKKVKAICIGGNQKPVFKNPDQVKEVNRIGAQRFRQAFESNPTGFLGVLRQYGTFGLLALNQNAGNIPVKNFNQSYIEDQNARQEIAHSNINEKFVGKSTPCKGCYVACKKQLKANSEYTALAEYESMALLGPNLGITSLSEGLKLCELCNRMGMDTITVGNQIAFLMDCYENGALQEDRFNFSIRFGESQKAYALIEAMAKREGELADIMARGVEVAWRKLGKQTRPYLRFFQGMGTPAHLPKTKPGIGFGYHHGPNPGDHMKLEHDWIAASTDSLKEFGLDIRSGPFDLDKNKVEIARMTQIYYSAMDALSVCMFIYGPGNILTFGEIVSLINGATGFDYDFNELMKLGESAVQLQKKLFIDFGGTDEAFLPYLEEETPAGPTNGLKINRADFEAARKHYYRLWNWDERGRPNEKILRELGV